MIVINNSCTGRWNSEAFRHYIKLGRSDRLETQKQVTDLLVSLKTKDFGRGLLVE